MTTTPTSNLEELLEYSTCHLDTHAEFSILDGKYFCKLKLYSDPGKASSATMVVGTGEGESFTDALKCAILEVEEKGSVPYR